jgi:hypothetical protein
MEKFEQLILLIDFDKTINDSSYPEVGDGYKHSKEVINKLYLQGCYIIINTCRTDIKELEAEAWLLKNGYYFHKINDQHPNGLLHYGSEMQITHGINSRKLWGHLQIDDLNLEWAVKGMPTWDEIDKLVQTYISNLGDGNKYNIYPNNDYTYLPL